MPAWKQTCLRQSIQSSAVREMHKWVSVAAASQFFTFMFAPCFRHELKLLETNFHPAVALAECPALPVLQGNGVLGKSHSVLWQVCLKTLCENSPDRKRKEQKCPLNNIVPASWQVTMNFWLMNGHICFSCWGLKHITILRIVCTG